MKAYLEHVNGRGGINGRKVRVVVLDDQAQPSRAASNAKQLVEQDKSPCCSTSASLPPTRR